MVDTIYRFTNSSDTESGLAATEKIIFNTGTVPDATGKATRTSFRMAEDLNPHPNPGRALNTIQDSLLGVMEVTIAGYFKNHNNTTGPTNLFNWMVGGSTNDDFENGRFGLELAAFGSLLTLKPLPDRDGTGYMLGEIYVDDVEDPRDEVPFIIKLYRNGVISEKALPTVT